MNVPIDRIARLRSASDSRACMEKIAKLLGLDKEATEEQIVEALEKRPDLAKVLEPLELDLKDDASEEEISEAVKAKLEELSKEDEGEGEDKLTLEERAKKEGKVVLSKDTIDALNEKVEKGVKAADELHQAKFDTAYDKAVDECRIKTSDETRKRWEKLYKADAETTLEQLKELPKLANTKAKGGTGDAGEVPEGADPERHDLDKRVKARMKEKGEDYITALDAVMAADAEGDED